MSIQSIPLTDSAINRGYIKFTGKLSLFPKEVLGGSNEDKAAAQKLTVYTPISAPIETDIDAEDKYFLRSDRGVYRELLRDFWDAQPGDQVELVFFSKYECNLVLIRTSSPKVTPCYNGESVRKWISAHSCFTYLASDKGQKIQVYKSTTGKEVAFDPLNSTKATVYLEKEPPSHLGLRAAVKFDNFHHHTTALWGTSSNLVSLENIYKQEILNDTELDKVMRWYL
ncbi:hypothetical protein [Vibrio sp. WXL210]|uniref:hypothetical protein n=1 Tax=Vibrio sp. WXL210 TaxID=3450709 RepID=UPI003EC55CAB